MKQESAASPRRPNWGRDGVVPAWTAPMHSEMNESVKSSAAGMSPAPGADPLGALNQLESHFGAIKKMHAEVAAREAKLSDQLADLSRRRGELETELTRVKAERESLAGERSELEQTQSDIVQKLKSIDEARRELEAKSKQVAEDRRQVEQDQAAAATLSQELEERESRVQTGLLQIEAREQTVAAQSRKFEAEQSAREAVLREKEIAVAQREKTAGKDADQLRREVESLKQRLAAGGNEAGAAKEQAAALQQQLDAIKRESEQHLADVETRLAEATAALASRDAEIAHLRRELEGVQGRLTKAEKDLAERVKAPAPSSAAPSPDLSKYETAIKLLNERLKKAEADKKALSEELEKSLEALESAGRGAGSISGDEHNARTQLRRARLRRYKGLLQAQARKIVQAQSSLSKRQTEAEQVLAQRSRIVAAMTTLQRREAEVAKQKSKSATFAMLFYATAGMAVLLALSWGAAYKIAPATYAARAVLHGDGMGRTPSEPEFVAWQQYVESLVNDPTLIDETAERLGRRGVTALASGGTLRNELKATMYTDISTPRAVTFEIRGDNATQTEIVLDTLVSAIVSAANGTRTQRPDGISAEVQHAASIGDGPIADQRLVYTGGIFAGSSTTFLALGLLISRRLGRLKRSANEIDVLDDALGDVDVPESSR